MHAWKRTESMEPFLLLNLHLRSQITPTIEFKAKCPYKFIFYW
jgi:hypothetical protein